MTRRTMSMRRACGSILTPPDDRVPDRLGAMDLVREVVRAPKCGV